MHTFKSKNDTSDYLAILASIHHVVICLIKIAHEVTQVLLKAS